MSGTPLFVGVDVGTGSARAGIFDPNGALIVSARQNIRIWHEPGGIVEQSSSDIWAAVCASVRSALASADVDAEAIKGIGFDATCSLVVLDRSGQPLATGRSEDSDRDVIVWMDHRATDQARRINAGAYDVLRYVGGRISPEMQTPKLLWLKERRPEAFDVAGHFFDLADFLTWRATGSLERSLCTVACKWTYLAHERRWDAGYFRDIGLGRLADEGFSRIGRDILDVGQPVGRGLTADAAMSLGLLPGTAVGASLIDAHAGSLGSLGSASGPLTKELALIAGTSACTMSVASSPAFVPGIWGPYFGALLPGLWLNEGGQSAFGAALDYMIAMHPAFGQAQADAAKANLSVLAYLEGCAVREAGGLDHVAELAAPVNIVPELLGNRSPHADPGAGAVMAGIRLDYSLSALVELFVATICGLAYGTRDIIDALECHGQEIETIVISGGAAHSPLLRRILSDATGKRVALPVNPEPVLLGGAILGATACGAYGSVNEAAAAMVGERLHMEPDTGRSATLHMRKWQAYQILKAAERQVRGDTIM